jgi:hypothetical protein
MVGKMKTILFSISILIAAFSLPVNADKLLIEGIVDEPPNSLDGIPRPRAGMSKERVIEIFGQPKIKSENVGNPPISRWTYDKFVVVFERDNVIHAVVRKETIEGFAGN